MVANDKDDKVLTYLSLFSGIGGFELGIYESRWKDKLINIGYSEIDKYADSIYKHRFPTRMVKGYETHKPFGDVREIRTGDLPNFDLLVGGFPCQAFSHAGKRRGFDDTRGTLFFEIARILKDKRPRYFLLENVKGLLSHNKGKTFKRILEVLAELGYDVKWEILNSKNFVPQNRERIFIKGYLREKCGREILSYSNKGEETTSEIDSFILPNSSGKIINKDGVTCALSCGGRQSGARTFIVDDFESDKNEKGGDIKIINKSQVNHGNDYVYDVNGVSRTLLSRDYKDPVKILEDSNQGSVPDCVSSDCDGEIKVVGNFSETNHNGANVYSEDGISPTIVSGSVVKNGLHVLEKESDVKLKKLNDKSQAQAIYDIDGLGCTLSANGGGDGGKTGLYMIPSDHVGVSKDTIQIKNGTKKGYLEAKADRDGILIGREHSDTRRGRVQPDSTGTLDTDASWGVYHNYRIRRLIPMECERLQGFPDNWTKYGVDGELISDTQRYKCLGNAVTVNVIKAIFDGWDLVC